MIIGVSAFVTGYVANGLSTHNWGWRSVKNGLISAGMSLIGWHSGGVGCSAWSIAGKNAISNIANAFMPSATFPIDRHFSFSISPVFGFGTDGLSAGFFESINYTDGKNTLSIGGGLGIGYGGWKFNATSGDWGIGYGRTQYAEGDFNGNYLGPQEIGAFSLSYNKSNINLSNDLWGDGEDRWRTTAAELTIGHFSMGSYVYTNNGKSASGGLITDEKAPIWGLGKKGTWKNGMVYFAPLWIGYTNNNKSFRLGYSHPMIQNLTQNFVHKYISPTPFFLDYSRFLNDFYSYYGTNNPLSIW